MRVLISLELLGGNKYNYSNNCRLSNSTMANPVKINKTVIVDMVFDSELYYAGNAFPQSRNYRRRHIG
jgi:hypothetical protein